jgi:hypothetical protein
MQTEQKLWTIKDGWKTIGSSLTETPQLVFVFGGRSEVQNPTHFTSLREFYPEAQILVCSTAGEILGTRVYNNSICVTAVHFDKTQIQAVRAVISNTDESEAIGRELARGLQKDGLRHTMVFSDGLNVNGTLLVKGLMSDLPDGVIVTGGLVADGANFKQTVVGLDEVPKEKQIVLLGFYGSALTVDFGSQGGWDVFGPDRIITRSKGNVLYELDGRSALEIYKEYLGEMAADLPSSGLLFPIRLQLPAESGEVEVVRTLLAVDEAEQSMTFAGDMPEGVSSTLMRANFDRLIDGASGAAKMSVQKIPTGDQLAILISCVGRKLVLKERIEEETESVRDVLGDSVAMVGFYSYGEISPSLSSSRQCQLQNQTMTITVFTEN